MRLKKTSMAIVATLGIAGMANGAAIAWTSQIAETEGSYGQYLSPGLFDTNGAPILAENVGGWAETFDGIDFAEGTITFGGGTANNFHEKTELSKTGTFGTTGPDTVTLTGLTIGTNYVIQALIFDGRNADIEPTANGRTIEVDGIDGGQYASGINNVTWGTGRLLTGTFTADATAQSFTLEAFNDGTSYGGQLNALTLFDPNGTPPPPPPPFEGIEPIPTNAPTAMQQAQIDRAYGMFCHFGINTFHNQEWTDGSKPASSYAPTAVDADQWVRTAYESGMRYFIMISKHHDGFCMWDSPYTTYDVGSSGNTTDVVRAVADACEKYGLSLAIYYSLWDRHETSYGSSGYIDYMENQLTELLTSYGPVVELWFDGGWDKPSSYWEIPHIYDLVKRLQPDCQVAVNWSIGLPGNPDYHVNPVDQETGYPIRYFPSDFRLGDPKEPKFPDPKRFSHPDAIDPTDDSLWYYMPFESTVTLSAQNKWFHNTSDLYTKSLKSLERTFNLSTAQNNFLVLNSPPNRDGVLIESNITALHDLAARLGLEPGRPIPNNVALEKAATASSVYNNDPTYGAGKAVDGNPDTRWASTSTTPWLEVDLGESSVFDQIILNEYGDRVQSFKVEYWDGAQWLEVANGTTIGESLRLDFPEVTGSKVRLSILSASDNPSIWTFKAQFSNSAYRQWREVAFGSGSATNLLAQDTADPDGDGLPNILEYVLDGYDPLVVDDMPMPTQVSTDGRTYIEYRLPKRPGVSPESLLGEYKPALQVEEWVVPVDSGNGDIVVEETADHWLLRMDLDLHTQGFFRAHTTIW